MTFLKIASMFLNYILNWLFQKLISGMVFVPEQFNWQYDTVSSYFAHNEISLCIFSEFNRLPNGMFFAASTLLFNAAGHSSATGNHSVAW